MKIKINKYPYNKDCVLAITLDDLHPESGLDPEGIDFGYEDKSVFWNSLTELKSLIPEIKFTLFGVASWIDRPDFPKGYLWPLRKFYRHPDHYKEDTFNLAKNGYKDWVKKVNSYIDDNLIEVAFHGLRHYNFNKSIPRSQEFVGVSDDEIINSLDSMEKVFADSGIKVVKGFRAPGWGVNEKLMESLRERNYLYTACSSTFTDNVKSDLSNGAGLKGQNVIDVSVNNGDLLNFTANCFPQQLNRAVEIANLDGMIILHSHIARTTYGLKYVDKSFVKNILKIRDEIKNQTLKHVWYAGLSDISKFIKAKEKLEYKILSNDTVEFSNKSKFDLRGLTINVNNQNYVIDLIKAGESYIFDKKVISLEKHKVTAVLTIYNGAKTVVESLQSLCDQTYGNLEIIVINDGSTDNTKNFIDNYKNEKNDSRLVLINQSNGGRSIARNRGVAESTGYVITFCEDDAKYDKDYIKNAMVHFEEKTEKMGGLIGPHYVWNKRESINTRVKDIERRRNFLSYEPKSAWFYVKKTFEDIGRYNENIELAEDIEPAIKLLRMGYRLVYEDKCRWLHNEPANFKKYLRRKFRGGVSLSILQKAGLRSKIIPEKYILLGILSLFMSTIFIWLFSVKFIILILPILVILLLLIRIKDIKRSIRVTDESIAFVCFGIFIEYIWWFSTLLGYLYGMSSTQDKMNKYLKGR